MRNKKHRYDKNTASRFYLGLVLVLVITLLILSITAAIVFLGQKEIFLDFKNLFPHIFQVEAGQQPMIPR